MTELRVLGAGSALPRVGFGCAGYALVEDASGAKRGGATLLDCGPGTVRSFASVGIELTDVRRVVLSHYHLDHCLDLFALFFARRNPALKDRPTLDLHGPPGLERLVRESPAGLGKHARDPDARLHEHAPQADESADERAAFEADGRRFTCVRNGHADVAVSWRVDDPRGWSLTYTGDTNEDPRVARLARGCDLLVAECSFLEEEATANHLTPGGAARLASEAGVGMLLLSHFYPQTSPAEARARAARVFPGRVECAHDGYVLPLGEACR